MEKNSKIYIAGHSGLVGSALMRNLQNRGYNNIVTLSSSDLDLMRQAEVEDFFEREKPDYVLDAAAKVGGIMANDTYRAEFIHENIMMQNNIIHSSHIHGVKKLLFLGSSCIYPKEAPQPMKEEYLLTGLMEPTNEPYAIAKIAGIKMCESYYRQYGSNFISVMPTNLYGPNDSYDLEKSHVLPALIRKMHLGKCLENNDWDGIAFDLNKNPIEGIDGKNFQDENKRKLVLQILSKYGVSHKEAAENTSAIIPVNVELWGTGNIYREFMYVDDMADACIHILENVNAKELYDDLGQTHINIGTGIDLTIRELAYQVKEVIGLKGKLVWDSTKPDGIYKKQLDVKLLKQLGWQYTMPLSDGLKSVYNVYSTQ